MSGFKKVNLSWLVTLFLVFNAMGQVVENPDADKTLSPYFFVKSEDSTVDQLPLKETFAEVNIAGVIADVHVSQLYTNEGKSTLEAIYVFPASTRAAVYDMQMTIGERVIRAKIKKRDDARLEYEQALAQGRTASLLEQQRPNVFQMNVGNIQPGDEIRVDLYYTEFLVAEDKVYEFVYPTVVGPRYSNQLEETAPVNDRWVKNPYLHEGEAPTYNFDINVTIAAGMPLQDILSISHDVDIDYLSKNNAQIKLISSKENGGNRDFILKYRLSGDLINPGLLLHKGEKENFFLMMLQPPERIKNENIPFREYIFIVDVSGSMNGFPLDISKKLLRDLIGRLRSGDRFNVLLFAAGSSVLAEKSLAATESNVNRAIRMIENEHGGGGTELLPALKRALALPRSEGFSRTVIIATDGYVNVEKESFDLIRNNLGQANMFAFGIGSSVNRFIIEGMARAGMGEPFVITRAADASAAVDKFRKYIFSPVLTRVTYQMQGFDAYDIEPVALPDVLADRPVILFGKWRGRPNGTIIINGIIGDGGKYTREINVADYKPSDQNSALKYLWARHRIALLADYNRLGESDERIEEITQLGLTYNLLTGYTSFIAADTKVRGEGGQSVTVHQPLPLPQGVSNLAVSSVAASGIGGVKRPGGYRQAYSPAMDRTLSEEAKKSELSPVISLENVTVNNAVLEKELNRLYSTSKSFFTQCYQKSDSFGDSGSIRFQVILDSSGNISSITINLNELKDKELEKCFTRIIKNWKFNVSGVTTTTQLQFEFKLGAE